MAMHSLTLSLPEPILQHLREVADATQQPVEQLARQSIEGNLPPSVATALPEMQAELLLMQALSVSELKQMANSQMPLNQQARHLELLEKNGEGALTPDELRELAGLRLAADRLMLRKAYAWAVLRWRGQPVPALTELPIE